MVLQRESTVDPPSSLKPIIPSSIRDLVYQSLRGAIVTHQFKPGAQLVVRDLAKQLKTSATPIMQAILRLSEEGLVEILPERARSSSMSARNVFASSLTRVRRSKDTRRAWPHNAGQTRTSPMPSRYSPSGKRQNKPWRTDQIPSVPSPSFLKLSRFHCYIVELSGNPYLVSTYQKLDAQVWASSESACRGTTHNST